MIYKCKVCGGSLNITDDSKVCVCEYCGTTQTVPNLDDEKINRLFERGNELARNCQFDDAQARYEEILSLRNGDPEVYWSLLMCKYGVSYVKDPYTGNMVPTIHRNQDVSIYLDEDYKLTLKYASDEQKEYYEKTVRIIDNIQKKYSAICNREEPFDIFICYKQTDDNTKRDTEDYKIAYDLYNTLISEGYRVFFSHVTLEDKIGEEYEPYIYAALKSSKVLLAIGTKQEYYNATWVKNEWSRYMHMMQNDHSKRIIPICANTSKLPEEFNRYQAIQIENSIVWSEDLVRNLKKIIDIGDKKNNLYIGKMEGFDKYGYENKRIEKENTNIDLPKTIIPSDSIDISEKENENTRGDASYTNYSSQNNNVYRKKKKKEKKSIIIVIIIACAFSLFLYSIFGKSNSKTTLYSQNVMESGHRIAVVTDGGKIDDGSYNQLTYEGAIAFAEKTGMSCNYYIPGTGAGDATDDDRIAAMRLAIENGAEVIVTQGFSQQTAIATVADESPEVKFVFVDGWSFGMSNVTAICYAEEEAGYLAGYAACKDGYTKLGGTFGGGAINPSCNKYCFGYIQGINAAAAETGMTVDVTVSFLYGDGFQSSPELETQISRWYNNGIDVVFCCGGSMFQSVKTAAEYSKYGKIIGVDIDQSRDSDRVITSACKNIKTSVEYTLNIWNEGDWDYLLADNTYNMKAVDQGVIIPTTTESWKFNTFTVSEYNDVYEKIVAGAIIINKDCYDLLGFASNSSWETLINSCKNVNIIVEE